MTDIIKPDKRAVRIGKTVLLLSEKGEGNIGQVARKIRRKNQAGVSAGPEDFMNETR